MNMKRAYREEKIVSDERGENKVVDDRENDADFGVYE